jgi:hypothetical protein
MRHDDDDDDDNDGTTSNNGTSMAPVTVNQCVPCVPSGACPRFCEIKDDEYLTRHNIQTIRDCEILNGNLVIIEAT